MSSIIDKISQYRWYHQIPLTPEISTPPIANWQALWNFSLRAMDIVDFKDKRVLDVGCRDGLFSFEAEKRGAQDIIGIDNDVSKGAIEFLIPYFKSKVRMYELNLYDLTLKFGTFDIILCFGVLYHLRYPVWGLKKLVDCLADGGSLLIESGMLVDPRYEGVEFLYCPFEDSPYESTSCTFFNRKGLETTMRSLGCHFIDCQTFGGDAGKRSILREIKTSLRKSIKTSWRKSNPPPVVERQFLTFRKDLSLKDKIPGNYWDGIHHLHTQ
jgi:SAM-dependent methyltransferase